jgi:hypothetical protein
VSVGESTVTRDAIADEYALRYAQLATLLADGTVSLAEWRWTFSELLTEMIANGYVLGRGGFDRMGDDDWLKVTGIVKDQHKFFEAFASALQIRLEDRESGQSIADVLTSSQAYVANRSALYSGSAINAFEQGKAAEASEGKGNLVLPAYPSDGGTPCLGACRCQWVITSNDDERQWECRWQTEADARVCNGCQELGMLYRSFVVPYDNDIVLES